MPRDRHAFEKAYSEPALREARPCPFCGSQTLGIFPGPEAPVIPNDTFRVSCPKCGCMGPLGDTVQRAVLKWNGDFAPLHNTELHGSSQTDR